MKTPKKNGLEVYQTIMPPLKHEIRKGKKVAVYTRKLRWRIYCQGRIIAASTEGYKRMRELRGNLESVCDLLSNVTISNAIADFKSK